MGAIDRMSALAKDGSVVELHQSFEQRGYFPWHDFSTGPDFWSEEAYQLFLQRAAAAGSNTFQLHNYNSDDHRHYGAQMMAWYGPPRLLQDNGSLIDRHAAYPAWMWSTLDGVDEPAGRGPSHPTNTSDFFCGLGAVFRHECGRLGAESVVSDAACPWPSAYTDAALQTFEAGGEFFRGVAQASKGLGIDISLAIGTPISVNFPAATPLGTASDSDSVAAAPSHLRGRELAYVGDADSFTAHDNMYCDGVASHPLHYGNESLDACRQLCLSANCACFDHGVPPGIGPTDYACRLTDFSTGTTSSGWHYTAYTNNDRPPPTPRTPENILGSY